MLTKIKKILPSNVHSGGRKMREMWSEERASFHH